jgi:hypothetical protein
VFAAFRSTRDAGMRLVTAHIDLAKAEAQAIGGEVARVAGLIGIAVAIVLMAGILAVVGTSLFLAEWLFGSMGWGVLHGLLLFLGIAVACVLAAVGVSGGRLGRDFAVAVLIGLLVAVLMAFALPNRAYTQVGEQLLSGIEPGVRPLVVGVVIWAVVGLLGGIVVGLRMDGGAAVAAFGGAVVGALLGAVSAIDAGANVGVAIGITVGYVAWIAAMAVDVAGTGVDTEALKARFTPTQTIETSKETLAWLQSKMPPGIGS